MSDQVVSFWVRCVSVLVLTIAAEIAAERKDVKGPGTFLPALIDELARLTPDVVERRAKVEVEAET